MLKRYLVLPLLSVCGAIAGCSSGGSVGIANSQPADSQTTDFGIVYVKRTVSSTTAQDDLRLRRAIVTSADLYLLNPSSAGGKEQNLTSSITKTAPTGMFYDIKDVDVSSDGTKVVFAMRGPVGTTQQKQTQKPPNWNIYMYTVAGGTLQKLLPTSDTDGTAAQYISPHILPDGRILFATTRQIGSSEVLLNEGKPEFEGQTEDLDESAFVLHVMNADGSELHQITYNASHDVDATVLESGRVMWSRWDHANGVSGIHLYTANPDGTDVELLYGAGSHNTVSTNPNGSTTCPGNQDCTVQFVRTREMQDGKVLALVRPYTNAAFGGNLQIIDVQHYVENNQAYPDTAANAGYSTTSLAQTNASTNDILTQIDTTKDIPVISPGGRFSSAFPLWDGTGRILVTWSECRLQNTAGTIMACTNDNLSNTALTAAPVLYSAWMFNPSDNTFKPLITPTEGVFVDNIVALQPRTVAPTYIADSYSSGSSTAGILDIRSVYDIDGADWSGLKAAYTGNLSTCTSPGNIAGVAQLSADCRPARFLRITKAVGIPPQTAGAGPTALNFARGSSFGAAGNYMREILGYVPIEPDGSVRVAVPPNVAFQVDVISVQMSGGAATGWIWRDFPLHRSWLQLLPGETLSCNGCHTPSSAQNPPDGVSFYSHGRQGLFTTDWAGSGSTAPFPNTTTGVSTCAGETMAEALVGYNCGAAASAASTLSPNVQFTDPWFGGGAGNEPINLSYTDASISTPFPTSNICATATGWNGNCRIVYDYPTLGAQKTAGQIEPLWDKCRDANSSSCAVAGMTTSVGTCTSAGCHDAATAPASNGYLNLADGASNTDANEENSYQQLTGGVSVTTTNTTTGVTTTTQVRGAEVFSGNAQSSPFFAFMGPNADATHRGLLSPAELRMLSEWVDIGAQYYNNPFHAPLN